MSRIDELIKWLCPGGVEFKALGSVAHTVPGLTGKTKADFSNGNARYVSYKNAFTNLAVDQDAGDFVAVAPGERQNALRLGDVVITGSSESRDEVGLSSVVVTEPSEPLYLNSFCFALRFHDPELLLPDFAKHLMRSDSVRAQIRRAASGVTRINISKARFMKARIPIPPLEVQHEIVRVLDPLTQLEAELEEKLEAELAARTQQYAHYRPTLLTLGPDADWFALNEIADYANGKAHEKLADLDGTVPMVTARFVSRNGEANRFVRAQDVLMPADVGDIALVLSDLPNGRALARTFYVDRANGYAINQRVARIRVKDRKLIDSRYLYHVLDRNPGLLKYDNGADQTHLSKSQVTGLRIPVPPIEEQRRVAELLDQLKSLVDEMNANLSAELNARRKHYKYYCDKLLSFEEATR